MSLSAIPRALREEIFKRDRGRCRYCQPEQFGQGAVFHINHVVPRSRGGETDRENLVLQCPCCSLHKSGKIVGHDPESNQAVSLFHPSRDVWQKHFTIGKTGECLGLSPIGRATIAALQMNDPLPRVARALQIQLGILSIKPVEN